MAPVLASAFFTLFAFASASPILSSLQARNATANDTSLLSYSLPPTGLADALRAAGITTKRATFLYGPAVGGGPYYPSGALGLTYDAAGTAVTGAELAAQGILVVNDSLAATAHSGQYDDLKTLDDYTKLYDGLWQKTSAPTGQVPGMLTNYTQDLLFSMQLLSFNPFAVSRLNPSTTSTLPFVVDDSIVRNLTGQTLSSLFTSGRLFYVDYRAQGALPPSAQYGPASDAYFYISPSSGDFLPLAIRTNVGSNLIYTPADSPTDWLLAKIMYNVNDFLFSQFYHLSSTHYVLDILYQSAVRTLSDDHPVLAIVNRLMYGELAIRPLAATILFPTGGDCDQFFAVSGAGAQNYTEDLYNSGAGGAVESNYFYTNLQRRGLLNSTFGPPLSHFPFYEDAQPIYSASHAFLTTFVTSYYSSDAAVSADPELQAWVSESRGPAAILEFPSLSSRAALIDLLAHITYLTSAAHHAVNTNQLLTASSVLPFHPSALYSPVPTAKGITDIVPFLPPMEKVVPLLASQGNFARPLLVGTERTLVHMFDDPVMLARMNGQTREANGVFMEALMAQSRVVSARQFDAQGLSQGMPFLWKALDPNVIPWSPTI